MYVVFEGVDCVGKSTQISLLKEVFKDAVFTAEPGGTALGEHLRGLLLRRTYRLSERAEFLLFLADRSQHYEEILRKNAAKLIISDRSFISGIAYAKNFKKDLLFEFNAFALENFFPKKIIFLQGDESLILNRLLQKQPDSIEKKGSAYFVEVQNRLKETLQFLRTKIAFELLSLDASETKEVLHQKIKDFIND